MYRTQCGEEEQTVMTYFTNLSKIGQLRLLSRYYASANVRCYAKRDAPHHINVNVYALVKEQFIMNVDANLLKLHRKLTMRTEMTKNYF